MKIAVDMTPYIPGGANGGIAPLIIATIRELVKRTDDDITILTTSENFDSLSFMDQAHISRCSIDGKKKSALIPPAAEMPQEAPVKKPVPESSPIFQTEVPAGTVLPLSDPKPSVTAKIRKKLISILRLIFHYVKMIIKWIMPKGVWNLYSDMKTRRPLEIQRIEAERRREKKLRLSAMDSLKKITGEKFDIFYCPFTWIPVEDSTVPVVSVLLDIQHKYFPWFFSHEELQTRDRFYEKLIRQNPLIISISTFSRQTFLDTYGYDPERIKVILSSVQNRLDGFPSGKDKNYLEIFDLQKDHFILYPANFWPHKNHRGLFTAFSMLKHAHPESDLKLVLTGFSGDGNKEWQENVKLMGIGQDVRFLGYVSDAELAALLRNCRFMIFPSFFEGFGMPVTEALHMGTTVLCSNVTSLPEVGGDCVFYFDPYNPEDIKRQMEYVLTHPEEAELKKAHISDHLAQFSLDTYIEKIIAVFQLAISEREAKS